MKNKSFPQSLRHAVDGIVNSIREERNMRFHLSATVLVVACAVLFGLTPGESAIVISLCALVICAELINSAIENAVDIASPVFNIYAKKAKDAAAGAVLVISIGSAVAGLIVFIPYGIDFLQKLI